MKKIELESVLKNQETRMVGEGDTVYCTIENRTFRLGKIEDEVWANLHETEDGKRFPHQSHITQLRAF